MYRQEVYTRIAHTQIFTYVCRVDLRPSNLAATMQISNLNLTGQLLYRTPHGINESNRSVGYDPDS